MSATDRTLHTRPRATFAWAGLLLAAASCGPSQPAAPPPDVVLIVVDTLRADRLGCYGYPRETSPALDALAAQGALFEDATAQGSWTLISMSSLWTGRYVTDNIDSPAREWPVLAEAFQQAGYRTIGSSANPLLCAEDGFARGFDVYRSYAPDDEADCDRVVADLWQPIDEALAMKERGGRQPLFLYLQPLDPHTPYRRHREFDAELPPQRTRPLQPRGWHARELALAGAPAPKDDPEWKRALQEMHSLRGFYDQEIRFVDAQLELLFQGLRERGLLENAVITLAADHGEGLWDHATPLPPERRAEVPPKHLFFAGHGYTLYQEAIRTPLVLWGRGVPKGTRIRRPVENIDLFPTLLELAGIEQEQRLDGRSLVDLMHQRADEWRTLTYSFVRQNASVHDRESGFKLVEPTEFGSEKGLEVGLYHLPTDRLERTNLARERPDEVERLRARLAEWIERHPPPSSARPERSPQVLQSMLSLGYTGDHTPDLEHVQEASAPDEPATEGAAPAATNQKQKPE